MHEIITVHWCEAIAFLGTSPPFWFKSFPKILLFFPFLLRGSKNYINKILCQPLPPIYLPRTNGRHSKLFFPSQRKLCNRYKQSWSTCRLNTTSDSWFFSCIHCCHGHIFTVVLMGAGFTLLILQTERKCHEFNLWPLTSTTPAVVL